MKETRIYRTSKRKAQVRRRVGALLLTTSIILVGSFSFLYFSQEKPVDLTTVEIPEWVDSQLLDANTASRPCTKLASLNDIVIHYVANPGTTAKQNRDYFNNENSSVSSHFVIGLDGEIIQCIPLYERSVASNNRNTDTISIEVCHPDDTGKFTDKSYQSLVKLVAWLIDNCGLEDDDIIRHYDITGKDCPRYFVQNEDAWEQFKKDVEEYHSCMKSK